MWIGKPSLKAEVVWGFSSSVFNCNKETSKLYGGNKRKQRLSWDPCNPAFHAWLSKMLLLSWSCRAAAAELSWRRSAEPPMIARRNKSELPKLISSAGKQKVCNTQAMTLLLRYWLCQEFPTWKLDFLTGAETARRGSRFWTICQGKDSPLAPFSPLFPQERPPGPRHKLQPPR